MKRIVLILCSLLLAELSARGVIHNDAFLARMPEVSNVYWRLLWEKRHLTHQATDYRIDTYHPLLGWYPLKNAKNVSMNDYSVSFNSAGIRGTQEYTKEKPPDTKRIVVVGDSFTFGEDVQDHEPWPAVLATLLPHTDVLNMGVHGYGLDQMTIRLETEGFAYHPDIVVYAFMKDDYKRVLLNFRDYAKPQYVLDGRALRLTNTPVPPPDTISRRGKFRPALMDIAILLRDRLRSSLAREPDYKPVVRALWTKAIDDSRLHNAVPVLLYLPSGDETLSDMPSDTEQVMRDYCVKTRVVCLSGRTYLLAAYKRGVRYTNIYLHYDALMHRIVAEGLAKDLGAFEK